MKYIDQFGLFLHEKNKPKKEGGREIKTIDITDLHNRWNKRKDKEADKNATVG